MTTKKRIIYIAVGIILWTTFIALGLIKGFLLKPISLRTSPEAFIEATKNKIQEEFVGNLSMIMIEDGKLSADYGYGANENVNTNSVFQVASVSKWITAFGVMKLVEEGKIDLDEAVDNYLTRWHLPPSDFDNKEVNVRRLLSHSAGLVDDLGYDGFDDGVEVQTLEESLTKAADAIYAEGIAKVGYEPGSRYMYSGASYTLLQLLIEEVSGQSFQEYMDSTVFTPLGMTSSTFDLSKKPEIKLSPLYMTDGSTSPPSRFTALAAASLFTSTQDLSKFMIANVENNPVLSLSTVDSMAQQTSFIGNIGVYGLGPHLYSQDDTNSLVIGHDGSSGKPVINTAARIDLKSKDGIVILETGNRDIASYLADEWLHWKFGIADFFVIQRNKSLLISLLLIGYILIIGIFTNIGRVKRRA